MGCDLQDIDMVVMTHLHRDHVGWNLLMQGEKYTPTFPNARYWMSAIDWEAATGPTCVIVFPMPRRVSGPWPIWVWWS